jgi:hypothetical protein
VEFERLRWIEFESDRLYLVVGIGPFPEDESANHLPVAAAVYAVGDPAVGFVSLEIVDGVAHVDQVSVLPDHGKKGSAGGCSKRPWAGRRHRTSPRSPSPPIGTSRGTRPSTAPSDSRRSIRGGRFEEVTAMAPGRAAIRSHERDADLHDLGPRVAMRRGL